MSPPAAPLPTATGQGPAFPPSAPSRALPPPASPSPASPPSASPSPASPSPAANSPDPAPTSPPRASHPPASGTPPLPPPAPPTPRAAPGPSRNRRRETVALVTDDFRLYHRLAPFLEEYGIHVLGLAPGQAVPVSVRVLLGGPTTDVRSIAVRDDLEATLLATFAALDPRRRPNGYNHLVFGVDPGHRVGLAVVADGETLLVAETNSVDAARERLAAWASGLSARVWEVHVGDGHPESGRKLLRAAKLAIPNAKVTFVGEEGTSPWFAVTGSRHMDAAIHIALRDPGPQPRERASRRAQP